MSKFAETYMQALPWSNRATDDEKALVEGNLRAFSAAYADMLSKSMASLTLEGGYNFDDAQWRAAFTKGVEAAIEVITDDTAEVEA